MVRLNCHVVRDSGSSSSSNRYSRIVWRTVVGSMNANWQSGHPDQFSLHPRISSSLVDLSVSDTVAILSFQDESINHTLEKWWEFSPNERNQSQLLEVRPIRTTVSAS